MKPMGNKNTLSVRLLAIRVLSWQKFSVRYEIWENKSEGTVPSDSIQHYQGNPRNDERMP